MVSIGAGIGLGGFAEGRAQALQQATADKTLDINTFNTERKNVFEGIKQIKQQIDIIQQKDPSSLQGDVGQQIQQLIQNAMLPLAEQAKMVGLNPQTAVIAPIQAILRGPSASDLKTEEGRATGAGQVAQANELSQGLGIDKRTAAGTTGIGVPQPDAPIDVKQLFAFRDSLLKENRVEDAAKIDAIIQAKGASASFDPRVSQNDKSKSLVRRADLETTGRKIVAGTNDAIKILNEGGDPVSGGAGDVNKAISSLSSTFKGLAETIGVDTQRFESGALTADKQKIADDILSRVGGAAQLSGKYKSLIVDLAFQSAAINGSEGRGVSDIDFENNLQQLGKASGSAVNQSAVIRSFAERKLRDLKIESESLTKNVIGDNFVFPDLTTELDLQTPKDAASGFTPEKKKRLDELRKKFKGKE